MPNAVVPASEFVYVDDDIVVLNKPAGMPSHPLHEGEGNTALDRVVAQFPEVAQASSNPREGGLVHRLDNNTSGILIFARHAEALEKMRASLKNGEIKKTYLALVQGIVEKALVLDTPIAHHPKSKKKMVVLDEIHKYFRGKAQAATTIVTPIEQGVDASLVRVTIEGGRRHQIRVHLAAAGHPLIGDDLYGGPKAKHLPGHALHADSIELPPHQLIRADAPTLFWDEAGIFRIFKNTPTHRRAK